MAKLSLYGIEDTTISSGLFGGNFLSTTDRLGSEGTFDEVDAHIGLTHLRYPGGSLTEHYFDITNPDASFAWDDTTRSYVFLQPMSEFFAYAAEQNAPVSIVLPTQNYLTEQTDTNGDRYAAVDHDALHKFVTDVVSGVYGDVDIQAFELGNEYWGSGEMSSVEYGRVAADMAVTVQSALNDAGHPDVDIAVQIGSDYMYAEISKDYDHIDDAQDVLAQLNDKYGTSFGDEMLDYRGNLLWGQINNGLIMHEFDTAQEQGAIDAVISHVYSRAPFATYSRDYHLDIAEDWHDDYAGLTNYVTEWNVSSNTSLLDRDTDYGLKQAHEYLNLITNFADRNVEVAHVWAVQQSAEAALATANGDVKVLGEMFKLMSDSLQGAEILDINPATTEEAHIADTYQANAFYNDGTLVMFVSSTSLEDQNISLDLSDLIASHGSVTTTSLKVASPDQVGDADAQPIVTEAPQNVIYGEYNLSIDASPYEVVRLEFTQTTLAQPDGTTPMATMDRSLEDEDVDLAADDNIVGATDRALQDEDMGLAADDNLDVDMEEVAELVGESMGMAGIALFLPLLLLM